MCRVALTLMLYWAASKKQDHMKHFFWCLLLLPMSIQAQVPDFSRDVWYHIFVRSFYDSNGDLQGDLRGITQKLDVLEDLGVTGILLSPIQASACYHNYFADDFFQIDPAYGTMADFLALRRETRKRKMRLVLDMEMQYITDRHVWYTSSLKKPESPYSGYILYNGAGNTDPESAVFNIRSYRDWRGENIGLMTLNLNHPKTLSEMKRLFRFWADPNGDGTNEDGVDGFRIDHMMDDLDAKGKVNQLYTKFWKPLIAHIKTRYPRVFFIGEQANWGLDREMLTVAGADGQFGFLAWDAFNTANPLRIQNAIDSTRAALPAGKFYLSFVENHDTNRSTLDFRSKAALTLLTGGIPILYYGQELNMQGKRLEGPYADGADIPIRQAYPWTNNLHDAGSAIWYKGDYPWWKTTDDPYHVAYSWKDATDLAKTYLNWHHYKRLIAFRKAHPALFNGALKWLEVGNPNVLGFTRTSPAEQIRVLINLSEVVQEVQNPLPIGGEPHGILRLGVYEVNIKGIR